MSYRTILRRRHELGMAVGERFSRISDAELDKLPSNILRRTPDAGEVVIIGAVHSRGLRIQRFRIRDSIQQVNPVSRTKRRAAAVVRRVYNVPCPNSLSYKTSTLREGHQSTAADGGHGATLKVAAIFDNSCCNCESCCNFLLQF